MFTEPLSGWRKINARPQRTKVDWAFEMEDLLRTRYAKAEKVILVCDNLNTHTRGAFYEAFAAEEAREIVKRIDFHYTPKHGSWLNISENELSSMTRQCLKNRRIGDIDTLRKQTEAWATCTNTKQRGVDWQFTIGDARRKLKSVYPQIRYLRHSRRYECEPPKADLRVEEVQFTLAYIFLFLVFDILPDYCLISSNC